MSMTPEEAFQNFYGRQATDADRLRLYKVKDALGLPDNDPMWSIFIALGYFQSQYEEMPERIVATYKAVAADTTALAQSETLRAISNAVGPMIAKSVAAQARGAMWRGIGIGALCLAAISAGIFFVMQNVYNQRIDEKRKALESEYSAKFASELAVINTSIPQINLTYRYRKYWDNEQFRNVVDDVLRYFDSNPNEGDVAILSKTIDTMRTSHPSAFNMYLISDKVRPLSGSRGDAVAALMSPQVTAEQFETVVWVSKNPKDSEFIANNPDAMKWLEGLNADNRKWLFHTDPNYITAMRQIDLNRKPVASNIPWPCSEFVQSSYKYTTNEYNQSQYSNICGVY